jgi:threonine/homoserine/homoserine lactone efflux protein
MNNQARVSNGLLWVFIALYVLMGAARLLKNPDLQRLTPFMSVAILMGFAIVHGIPSLDPCRWRRSGRPEER